MSSTMDSPTYYPDLDSLSVLQDYNPPQPFNLDPYLLHTPSPPPYPDPTHNSHLNPSYFYPNTPFFDDHEPLRHQLLGHRRSVSVPPEDLLMEQPQEPTMVFHRGGTLLGDFVSTPKKRGVSSGKKRGQGNKYQYSDTSSPSRGGKRVKMGHGCSGPTSAPYMPGHGGMEEGFGGVVRRYDMRQSPSPRGLGGSGGSGGKHSSINVDVDAMQLKGMSNVDTAAIGMLSFAARIAREVDAMKDFLSRGIKDVGQDEELESMRQEKRAINHKITSLTDTLEILPLKTGNGGTAPKTGTEMREMDGEEFETDAHAGEKMDKVLEEYGIPYSKDMFLFEKKMLYLRFLGVGRGLMHAVLD